MLKTSCFLNQKVPLRFQIFYQNLPLPQKALYSLTWYDKLTDPRLI